MDIKNDRNHKTSNLKSPDLRLVKWFEKSLRFKGYEFPLKKIVIGVIVTVSAAAIFGLVILSGEKSQAVDPHIALEKEVESLTASISKFMELPADEQPNLATVTDRAKLKDQEFFAHAQNGDKLLIYRKSKKAILFRPETGKLVEVTNLTAGSEKNAAVASQNDPLPESQPN